MATQYKNTNIQTVTTKKVIPNAVYSTGTLTSTGVEVTLAGGGSTATWKAGGWLYSAVNGEIRKITYKTGSSTTIVIIDHAFTADLVAEAYTYNDPSDLCEISWLVNSGGTATIDGVTFPENSRGSFGKNSRERGASRDFVDPIIVDGSGAGTVIVTTFK